MHRVGLLGPASLKRDDSIEKLGGHNIACMKRSALVVPTIKIIIRKYLYIRGDYGICPSFRSDRDGHICNCRCYTRWLVFFKLDGVGSRFRTLYISAMHGGATIGTLEGGVRVLRTLGVIRGSCTNLLPLAEICGVIGCIKQYV